MNSLKRFGPLVAVLVIAMACTLSAGCFGDAPSQQHPCTVTVSVGVYNDAQFSQWVTDTHTFHYQVDLLKCDSNGNNCVVDETKYVTSTEAVPGTVKIYFEQNDGYWHVSWHDRFGDHDDHFQEQDSNGHYKVRVSDVALADGYIPQDGGTQTIDMGSTCNSPTVMFKYRVVPACNGQCSNDETCVDGQCISDTCGTLIVGNTCTESGLISCPSGYGASNPVCPTGGNINGNSCTASQVKVCPTPGTLNGNTCNANQVTSCPGSGTLNGNTCVEAKSGYHSCPDYQYQYQYSGTYSGKCTANPSQSCPAGYQSDHHGGCTANPTLSCPTGYTMNSGTCKATPTYTCTGTTTGNCPTGYASSPITNNFGDCGWSAGSGYQCSVSTDQRTGTCVCADQSCLPPSGGGGSNNIGGGESGGGGNDASGVVLWNPRPPISTKGDTVGYHFQSSNTTNEGNIIEIFDALGHLRFGPTVVIGTNSTDITHTYPNVHTGSGSQLIDVATTPQNNLNSRWTVVLLGIDPLDGPIAEVLSADKMFVKENANSNVPMVTPTPVGQIEVTNGGSSNP